MLLLLYVIELWTLFNWDIMSNTNNSCWWTCSFNRSLSIKCGCVQWSVLSFHPFKFNIYKFTVYILLSQFRNSHMLLDCLLVSCVVLVLRFTLSLIALPVSFSDSMIEQEALEYNNSIGPSMTDHAHGWCDLFCQFLTYTWFFVH